MANRREWKDSDRQTALGWWWCWVIRWRGWMQTDRQNTQNTMTESVQQAQIIPTNWLIVSFIIKKKIPSKYRMCPFISLTCTATGPHKFGKRQKPLHSSEILLSSNLGLWECHVTVWIFMVQWLRSKSSPETWKHQRFSPLFYCHFLACGLTGLDTVAGNIRVNKWIKAARRLH